MAGSGQKMPTLQEYAEIEKWHKTQEISFFDGLGKIAEGGEQVMTDLSKAFGAVFDNPADVASKMPATAVEAFSQGTRNFYGMLAESQNTDSVLFRVKDFLNGTGTIEDRYNQYISALKFNKDSADLVEGKQTLVMDKDMINHEVTQAMAYIADPTLFIPFGKVASTGLRAVGLGERLALAGAKSAAIKNGIIGNTIKWGVGQPLEFLGGAVRNTIDFGLDKAGAAFEATTGVGAKEFAQTARMSGIGFSASAVAGYAVPYASTLSDAYLAGSSARGFGEALTLMGETMSKNKFGRGINSWAAESLEQAKKNGVKLSPHAEGLLKAINAVDPMFAYGFNAVEASAQGAVIGGGLGYLSAGQEGMYSGIGAGVALGAVGGTAGKVVADLSGGTNVARRVVQAKMVIEGHKVTNPEKAMFFQAMQKTAEARGQDVDLVNGIISGIDKVAPNFEFHAMTPDQFRIEAERKGYNPFTGKFAELSAIDHEFGGDRPSKSKAMYILRSIGGDFVGNSKGFLEALKRASAKDSANPNKPAGNIPSNLRKYTDVAKTFDKLTKTQQDAILKEIDRQADVAKEQGGNTKLRDHYDALTWSEAWTDSLVKKFESDREGARKDIIDMLAQETDKNGKLNRKGRALTDKLRAEGFLDREGKLLRERNLLQADMTLMEFASVKGGVMRREADGKTHMYINLNKMGSETFPHELFHTIMRESPMKKHFTDSLIGKLIGSFDDKGNLVRTGEVNINQVRKFFKKYIDLTSYNEDGTLNPDKSVETMKLVNEALAEFESAGSNKKISDKARGLLEHYTEEFGAYYFSHWLMGRNRNTLFFGGELKGIEGLVERTKDSFKDFWQSKISKANPEFDFSEGLNASFDRSKGLGRISSIDYYMRDMVRAASNANRDAFNPDAMTADNLKDFERSNGLRNLTAQDSNRRLNPREQVTQNIRLGKEAHKILTGLDKKLRTSQDTVDENGKSVITGRLSENELDALVKGGIVPRAWADKVNQGYAMLDGTVSNVFSAGYLGKTEQTTDASYPRLTGKDVAFKNRKAVLFDVETKIKADGTFYTLFHTLDLAVIEQEANRLFQNTEYRKLFDGDRSVMEADFFRYISNASKASTDTSKLDSAALLDKGDGLGAQRRDVLQQMGRMALQVGDAYKHQPIAVIPEGIRHSVTTFNIDGMTTPRVEQGARYDINMKNAHKFIRENWQPDDMRQETTPNGRVFTHESKFKFVQDKNGKVSAYTSAGNKIGTYGSLREATTAGKTKYNAVYKNFDSDFQKFYEKKEREIKNFEPLEQSEREKAIADGDLFGLESVKQFINGRPVLKFARDEFIFKQARDVLDNKEKLKEVIERKRAEYAKLIDEKNYLYNEDKRLVLLSIDLLDIDPYAELKKYYKTLGGVDEFSNYTPEQETQIAILREKLISDKEDLSNKRAENQRQRNKIEKRRDEILKQFDKDGVTDFVNMFDEKYIDGHSAYLSFKSDFVGDKLIENIRRRIESNLTSERYSGLLEALFAKEYDDQIQTGKPIVILGTHGTTNARMMIQRAFRDERLGERYANQGAFSATLGHFLGNSAETSSAYSRQARFGFAHPEGTDKFRVMDITWVVDSKIGSLQSSLSEPSDPKFKLSPDKIKSITAQIERLKKQKAKLYESYEFASAEETKADTSLLQEAGRLYNYIWGNLDTISTDKLVAESARILTILQYFEEKRYFLPQGDVYRLQRAVDKTIKKKLNIPFEETMGLKPESTTRSAFDDLITHYEYFPNKTPLPMSSVYELYNGAENRNSIVKLRKHSVDRTFLSGRKINSTTSREYAQNDLLALFNQHTEITKDLGLYEKFEYAKESGIHDAQDKMLNAYLESTTVERIIDQNPYKNFIDNVKKLQKEHDFQELLMPEAEKAYPEATQKTLIYTPMKVRALMAFDNPMVVVDPRAYEEHFISPHMIRAIEAGHDGIIFKRFADGGSKDNIIVSFKGNEKKIMEIDTTLDKQTIPRKDDDGNLINEKFLQPDDEVSAPKKLQGIKLDMNKAYDVFRQEYEESTGQSWTKEKFMQRSQNWQFFGDENGFVAVRPQKSGFIKLVGMAGDNKSKLRAIQQLQEQKLPVWGMVSKNIKDIAVRRGMREPNMIERTVLKQVLNSAVLGDAELLGFTSDNGVRLRYPDVGEVIKYMIGSPEYYQKLRSAFGEQVKNKIGFQPDEGGRKYTDDQFNKEFIGKFASENPDIADKFLIRIKENDGNTLEEYDYKIIIYDKETKKPVARSKWQLFENDENGKLEDAAADVEILNDAYRGMKLSHLMQSERLERSRSLGAEAVRSQITNQEGIPIKNYAKTIGADKGEIASSLADRFDEDGLTKFIPATMENFKQEMDLSKAHDDGIWKPTVYYRAKLDPKAWYQPAEDWSTERAIKAREGQSRQLWSYPDTENFKKWAGKLKFISNEEDATKGVNYEKGFVTTVYKGVAVRSFDRFSERTKVELGERPVSSDPNFFIADATAAERYAGGGYFDVENLNADAQKAASRGQVDMYYIKSNKPANLLNAHKLELKNPRLYEVVNRFWENNIKESGHEFFDPRTRVDRFLLEIAMGDWLSPKNETTTISPFGQPWRMNNWVKFHEYLLKNGYDSVVIHDNSVSKKAPTVVVPQETAKVKGSSNYGKFSKTDTRYNFQPDETGRKYNKGQMDNQFIGRQAFERRDLTDGIRLAYRGWDADDAKNDGRKLIILTRTADGAEIGRIDFDYKTYTKYGMKSRGFGDTDSDGLIVDGINVKVREQFQGKGYQHILYSEMFERARAIGAVGFSQSIENKKGLPLKSVNRVIGEADNFIASLSEPKVQKPTQENFDRLMANAPSPTGNYVSNEPSVQNWGILNKKAWYQPDEKIGTQSSNVQLLLEGMTSGRILRTSSYKGLGLEDANLIAHTPDTAKIGQVTAGDKALADLQGGIFYAIANGKKIWASNFAGEGETNILVKFANRALKTNKDGKTYIMLVKADNSKIFASVDGARGVSSIFKHLNDTGVMSDTKYLKALRESAKKHLKLQNIDGLGKEELFTLIDSTILNSEDNKISFERRAKFSREIATQLVKSKAFDSEKNRQALQDSFHSGFNRGFSKVEMERVFGNLMAEDIIKDVPLGHVYGAIEIVSPLSETKESNHRGYNASIEQTSGDPARLIIFDKTAHAVEVLNKKSGESIKKTDPTRHLKDSEGNYVYQKDDAGELILSKKGKPKRVVEYEGEGSYISYTGGNIPYQEVKGKSRMPFQPAEGWRDWQSERTSVGSVIKNTAGYVIMVQKGKFKVYNPYKAIVGIYDNEDQAKRRVQKDEPRR
jgi:GNAT superfamily N-acetyltransferase